MRIKKSAAAGIVKASRTGRARAKKIASLRKKAQAAIKAAKKTLTKIKADCKIGSKQFEAHIVKAEELYNQVEELGGGPIPTFPSVDWEDYLNSDLEQQIVYVYEEVETIEKSL